MINVKWKRAYSNSLKKYLAEKEDFRGRGNLENKFRRKMYFCLKHVKL